MINNIGFVAQEIGQINDDGSIRFMTGSTHQWKVVSWQGRFAVCKFSNERMRITASGELMFGDSLQTPDNALEVYWFNTPEWAGLAHRRLIAIDGIPRDITLKSIKPIQYSYTNVPAYEVINPPEMSEWKCHLFGATGASGITYQPVKGKEPNRFVRWCMKVMLGCTWRKE
jgi:hypothetical protein